MRAAPRTRRLRREARARAGTRATALLCALAFAAGCARNPVSGRPELVLISAEQERAAGREQAQKVEEIMGFADLESARAYVRAVGARLAAESPRRDVTYSFEVVDLPEPNAFALPGGPVYVSRGLLVLANSEDELAAVLGHEIGHVAARHVVQRLTWTAPFALLVGLPAALVGMVSRTLGAVVAAPGAVAGSLVLASHGRGQEREADRLGMELAARAGYDPAALVRFLETLARDEELTSGRRRRTHFLDSHPATRERVEDARRHAAELQAAAAPRPLAPTREAFLGRIEGLLVGENPDQGVFLGDRFVHPPLGFALDFPPGWTTRNEPFTVVGVDSAEDPRAFLVLQLSAEADDPREGARADGLDEALLQQLALIHVGGLPATRVFTEREGHAFLLTWVALEGRVYRLACVAPGDAWETGYRRTCERAVGSFERLDPRERAALREERLRVAHARPGERLGELLARRASAWEAQRVAIANALAGPDAGLDPGRAVKVPVTEPYARPGDAPGSAQGSQ